MAEKLNDDQLLNYLDAAEANSIHADDELNNQNKRFFDYYAAAPWNEVDDESKVISTDVFDLVESVMPSLVQVFLGVNEIHKFKPINTSERELAIAEEKTKYINQLVRNQPESYKTIFDWLKGAEIYKYSAVNFGFEEEDTVRIVEYEGLTEDEKSETIIELQLMMQDGAEVDIEDVDRDEDDDLFDLKATIKKTVGRYFNRYINPEDFVITSGATSEDDAEVIGHDSYPTKSELIAMGYDETTVRELPNTDASNSVNRENRLRDQGGADAGNSSQWTGEIVELQTRYIKVDRDGDGIAERLRMIRVGETLLEAEPYEIAPYAVLSSILMPGQLIGMSHAEVTTETQDIKSTLLRQTMMNMYQVNSARMAANSLVNMDDLLTQRLGGIVRVKGEGNPLNSMAPLPVPFIGDKALLVLQYADSARAQRTGALMTNQALDSDKLGKETATRFEGVQDAANSKVELVARGHAETGFRKLFMGMLWTVTHFQKTATEVMVLGKELTIDPRRWLSDQPMVCNVGLAAGDNENVMTNMTGLLQISQQLAATGSPITDQSKVYNILSRMTKAMEEGDVGEFFNNPEVPEETLQAQVEQLQRQNFQMEQQLQNDPLAKAAMVEQQGKIAIAQGNLNLKERELDEKARQFNITELADANQKIAELEKDYIELELKHKTDIQGRGQ